MCDWSAESVARRDAEVGDQLVTRRISVHTIGLSAPQEADIAVCVKPGTKLIVSGIPEEQQNAWGVGEVAPATFERRDTDIMLAGYRDGLRFEGRPGVLVLFQHMPLGLSMTVEVVPGKATFAEAIPEGRHAFVE